MDENFSRGHAEEVTLLDNVVQAMKDELEDPGD